MAKESQELHDIPEHILDRHVARASLKVQEKVAEKLEDRLEEDVDDRLVTMKGLPMENVPTGSLIPNTWNPNRQDEYAFELLISSMQDDGFTQPILISADNVIIDGEHRWRAATVLGYEIVPVVRSAMTGEQMRIATIRHNVAVGSHDIEHEASLIQSLAVAGFGDWVQESLQLSDVEMRHFLDEIEVELPPEAPPGASAQEVADMIDDIRRKEEEASRQLVDEWYKMQASTGAAYRLSLVYAGKEGHLVKKVLGRNRSSRILELCEQYGPSAE